MITSFLSLLTYVHFEGSRFNKKTINFINPYMEDPEVVTTLSLLDVICNSDHRVFTVAENVNKKSFEARVNTWHDTCVWGVSISWISFGKGKNIVDEDSTNKKMNISNTLQEENKCCVCFDSKIDTVLVPCGHLCLCLSCAKVITEQNPKRCPICKTNIQNVVKTFTV